MIESLLVFALGYLVATLQWKVWNRRKREEIEGDGHPWKPPTVRCYHSLSDGRRCFDKVDHRGAHSFHSDTRQTER